MIRLLALRWILLAAALLVLAWFLAGARSVETLAVFGACGLGWSVLSWCKARSLDAPQPRQPW